jgi:2',3'-cyclic-nucleotide 2'-phosphodiesterase (5'-nucleotidase family)
LRFFNRRIVVLGTASAALLWATLGLVQPGFVRDFTILHLNDLHARLTPAPDGSGGFAHVATLLRRERAAAPASITLHAGDLVQGTPVSTMFEGVPVYEVANRLGIDVNTLGNHEFDYGWRKIGEFLKVTSIETVNANVVNDRGERMLEKAYVVREVGGVRLAIIGALLENLPVRATEMGPWHVAPVVESLRPVVAEAKQRADLVLVLGHIRIREAEQVLEQLPDVAVVVFGHPHDGLEKELERDGRIGVQASGYGRDVGRLRLRYDTERRRIVWHEWTRLPVDSRVIPADPDVNREVQAWEAKVAAVVDVPIGRSTKLVDRDAGRVLMQQALIDRFKVDAAFIEPGSVRDTIPEGALLARHLWNMSPFQDPAVTLSMSGRELADLFPNDLQPMLAGGATTIDPAKTYRLSTSRYTALGWIELKNKAFPMTDEGITVRDVVIGWIKQRRVIP